MPNSAMTIICPKCQQPISIDEVLVPQVEETVKAKYRQEMRVWQENKEKQLQAERDDLKKELTAKLDQELKSLKEDNAQKETELAKARELELQIRKDKNKLEEDRRQLELTIQRQLDEERDKVRKEATEVLLEEHRLKDLEKDKRINDMLKQVEELKLKAQQGSQQLQGEVLELELEQLLRTEFPMDEILPVPKGVNGADVIQRVHDSNGRVCGVILWESKRTKNWTEEWTNKLKDDLRASKADVAILVSTALPDGIKNFGPRNGIYVTCYECVVSLAKMMRLTLAELSMTKLATVGKNEKMEVIWNYLSGNDFRHKVEAIVEAFSSMKTDLDKEKMIYAKLWAKREKQIQRVIENTIGMHGDLQGLMGASLPEIKSLEITTFETIEQEDSTVVYTKETNVNANLVEPNMEELFG